MRVSLRVALPASIVLALCLTFSVTGCLQDGGYASPSDRKSLRSMSFFKGRAHYGPDTSMFKRALEVGNPRLAVVWRAVGRRDDFRTSGEASVDADPPYEFTMDLFQPPPRSVIDAPEISLGIISLFSDADGNGAFDRAMHPDFIPAYRKVDSLYRLMAEARAELLAASEVRPRRAVRETLYVTPSGALLRAEGERRDTIMKLDTKALEPLDFVPGEMREYQRMLTNQNRWERFFALRKKDNEYYVRPFPVLGHLRAMEVRYDRALFPRPGREEEWYPLMRKASEAAQALDRNAILLYRELVLSGKMDYPFAGYGLPGVDWLAGRTTTDLVLYIDSPASLDTLLAAIPGSTFRVKHADRIRAGYNLFRCDDQYGCDVLAPGEPIQIILGSSEIFFNPDTPYKPLYSDTTAKAEPAALTRAEGRYALNGGDTVEVAFVDGELWCEFGVHGFQRVNPIDSLGFHAPKSLYQGYFQPGDRGFPDKIIQHLGKTRHAYIRAAGKPSASALARIEKAARFARADLDDAAMARFPAKYEFGTDTLRVAAAGGDSLAVVIPGFRPMVFHAASDSLFRAPWGEWSLEFRGCEGSGCRSLRFGNVAAKKYVPVYGVVPSKRVTATALPAEGPEWLSQQGGSGPDSYQGTKGKGRYTCSQDGAFLRPGDGIVSEVARGAAGDSISLRMGGDAMTFRIPGMKDKLAALELRNCADKDAKGKRIRVSLWGGSEPGSLRRLPGGEAWLAAGAAGSHWLLDSLSVDADPWFLRVVEEDVQDAPMFNAFDGYRLGARP